MKKIALAQINIEYGNFDRNVSIMENCLSSACEQHCDLVMMPELWSSGFDLHNIDDYPKKNSELLDHFQSIADDKHISIGGSLLGSSGAAICYDLRFPDHFSSLTFRGVEAFLLPAHWPLARIHHWDVLLQARAIENQAYMIAVNSVGKSGKDIYGGHSMVIAPDGEILLQCPDDQDGLFTVAIDPGRPAKVRKDFPMER